MWEILIRVHCFVVITVWPLRRGKDGAFIFDASLLKNVTCVLLTAVGIVPDSDNWQTKQKYAASNARHSALSLAKRLSRGYVRQFQDI